MLEVFRQKFQFDIYRGCENLQVAAPYHQLILESNREDADCLVAAGSICAGFGMLEDARVFFNRVVEIDPRHQEAQEALAQLDVMDTGKSETPVIDSNQKMAL